MPRLSSKSSRHPLQESEDLLSCIRLLNAENFPKLARPLPRCQDLPKEYFGAPSSPDDQVISVSHAWRNQAHPDPTCQKTEMLGQLLSRCFAEGEVSPQGQEGQPSVFLFVDFVSIPQRPFRAEQAQRTVEEVEAFNQALRCMHKMYFYSDRIVHLPWEDATVPGEGLEEMVPVEALQGLTFTKVGDCVQVAQHALHGPIHLFDQVMSVDGQTVTSIAQLESLLAEDSSRKAKLRRLPFGNYSQIPADARGWVFLERFITMVKCAMMDEETAKQVVVTPSESIFQQIMRGASLLREASLREAKSEKHGQLKQVLEGFLEELRRKHFSPASTDKMELASSLGEDREVVGEIMQGFVEHLADHWEAEAKKQQSLATRLTAIASVAGSFMVEWDHFSEAYAEELAAASTANPWPLVAVVAFPLLSILTLLLYPLPDPIYDGAPQVEFLALAFPFLFTCLLMFPVFLAKTSHLVTSRHVFFLFVAWAASVAAAITALQAGASQAWGIFPIPMLCFINPAVAMLCFPLLWCCFPRDQRSSSQFQKRLFSSMQALNIVTSVYGLGLPLLNATVPHVSEDWQPWLFLAYLVVKLVFEVTGVKLSKVLGADVMPFFTFSAAIGHQVSVCMAFSKVTSVILVVEQMCFDLLENCYHLYSLLRLDPSAAETPRRAQYIVASLMLREFVELFVPASFLLIYQMVRVYRPQNSELFCGRPEQEVQQTVYYLLVDLAFCLVMSLATYAALARRGYRPLLLLRGVLATKFFCILLIAESCIVGYLCLSHSHWGTDLSFKFLWLTEQDAVWECGLTWRAPPEVA